MFMDEKTAYRLLEEYVDEGVVEIDERGIITWVNRKAAESMKYEREEMVGKHYLEFVHSDYRDDAGRIYEEVLKWGSYEFPALTVVFPLVKRNGEMLYGEVRFSNVIDEKGSRYSVLFIRDRTEEYELLMELEELNKEYGIIVDLLRNFLAIPLAYADILKYENLAPKDKDKIVGRLLEVLSERMPRISETLQELDDTWLRVLATIKNLKRKYLPADGREFKS